MEVLCYQRWVSHKLSQKIWIFESSYAHLRLHTTKSNRIINGESWNLFLSWLDRVESSSSWECWNVMLGCHSSILKFVLHCQERDPFNMIFHSSFHPTKRWKLITNQMIEITEMIESQSQQSRSWMLQVITNDRLT